MAIDANKLYYLMNQMGGAMAGQGSPIGNMAQGFSGLGSKLEKSNEGQGWMNYLSNMMGGQGMGGGQTPNQNTTIQGQPAPVMQTPGGNLVNGPAGKIQGIPAPNTDKVLNPATSSLMNPMGAISRIDMNPAHLGGGIKSIFGDSTSKMLPMMMGGQGGSTNPQ